MPNISLYPGEVVSALCQQVEYSDYNMMEPSTMVAGPYMKNYPKSFARPTLQLTFIETEEALIKAYFAFWRSLIIDKQGLWGKKTGSYGYGKDIILLYLNSQGLPLREVKFRSAFPLVSYEARLDYSESDILKVRIPFACDRVEEGLIGTVGSPLDFSGLGDLQTAGGLSIDAGIQSLVSGVKKSI